MNEPNFETVRIFVKPLQGRSTNWRVTCSECSKFSANGNTKRGAEALAQEHAVVQHDRDATIRIKQ